MNYYYFIPIAIIVILMCYSVCATSPPKKIGYAPRLNHLIDAIQFVESGPRDPKDKVFLEVGKSGERGPFQIKPIMIEEVNNVLDTDYDLDDWLCYDTSRKILRQYFNHLCLMYSIWKGYLTYPSEEVLARKWNSGHISGPFEKTDAYWEKVSQHLDKNVKTTIEDKIELNGQILELCEKLEAKHGISDM
jgi:hypothetical protein